MAFDQLEKLVVRLTTNLLGRTVEYQLRPENVSVTFRAIFDNIPIEVNGVSTSAPTLNIDLAQLSRTPSIRDKVIIGTESYDVMDVRSQSYGSALLVLRKS